MIRRLVTTWAQGIATWAVLRLTDTLERWEHRL